MSVTAAPCPRCTKHPVEVTTMGESELSYLPACACYPHPPLCISCGWALHDERCRTLLCPLADVVQPAPIVDPLWGITAP